VAQAESAIPAKTTQASLCARDAGTTTLLPGRDPAAASEPAQLLQEAMHHERVDQTETWVIEGLGDRPDDLKTEAPPKIDGSSIGADHEIELHGEKAE
jgi:hypothetical protein